MKLEDVDISKLTPMMVQYVETLKENPGCILFYRLGDFYEMFFDDAITVSKELEITLTGKSCGLEERAPMCGVPFHSAENYINRLVAKGYRVAICEQVEDPKSAKGLVKREVVKIITPGTNMSLSDNNNNYIMCISYLSGRYGIAAADVSTGDFYTTSVNDSKKLLDEIMKYSPSEIICNESFLISDFDIDNLKNTSNILLTQLDDWYFADESASKILKNHFHASSLIGLGLDDNTSDISASGALLRYLYDTQKCKMLQMSRITPYSVGGHMIIDNSTRRNLELTETMREKQKRGSLFWVLDKTKTAMGARMLSFWIKQPLIDKDKILLRLDAVDVMLQNMVTREELQEYLTPVYDLERLISRVALKSASPRDLTALKTSLSMLPAIKTALSDIDNPLINKIYSEFDALEDIKDLIEKTLVDEPPIALRDGGLIKDGAVEEVDRLRSAKTEGKNWLSSLEEEEKEKTGIKNLRIKYNKVFGYYLEVTKSNLDMVPDYFIRKQTLTNAERFITPKLKELEDTILGAQERLTDLEYEIFSQLRENIASNTVRIQKTAHNIAVIDVICSLAKVAENNNYVRPELNTEGIINISEGRHPVVEKMIPNDMFVSNDTYLNNDDKRIAIITGPNMAGKSTYMRQCALIVLMAQMGSFVPASSANIGICDRIFTRVGASDDLASGQSTFMVEMNEVANILRNATSNSLLILDEIGRGTSTFDGLSIAWAVVEHISNPAILGAKTLFATHYHELTELEGKLDSVTNYCIAVQEKGDDIVFLRKIVSGGADKSYGIQVAKLAGVPQSIIDRAKEISIKLSNNDITLDSLTPAKQSDNSSMQQLSFFDSCFTDPIVEEIKNIDLSNITPLEALNLLNDIQKRI